MGKHSTKKAGRHSAGRRDFEIPVGPADESQDIEEGVPEEIEKTAAGKMQTGVVERVEGQTSDEEVDVALLDEWMLQNTPQQDAGEGQPAGDSSQQTASIVRKGKVAIAAVVALAAVIIVALMIVVFRPGETPTQVVDGMLCDVQARDFDTIGASYLGDAEELESSFDDAAFSSLVFKNHSDVLELLNDEQKATLRQFNTELADFTYSVTAESVDDDTAKVTVKFQTADFGQYYQNVMGDYLEEEVENDFSGKNASDRDVARSFVKQMGAHMGEVEKKTREATTDFDLVKVDGVWKVSELSDDNVDAMTGGLDGISKEMRKLYESLDK